MCSLEEWLDGFTINDSNPLNMHCRLKIESESSGGRRQ